MKKIRTRIAPSPTGSPHIGTAYAALFNYAYAKKNSGSFILRIEDTDRTRFVEGSEQEIINSLDWLGLLTDEGPEKGGEFGPYRQSERLPIYKEYVEKLIRTGKAYYCNCSSERLSLVRKEQQDKGEIPHYDRKCRFDPPKETNNAVVRLAIPLSGITEVEDRIRGKIEFQNKILDDQVLLKSDQFPTYHLASVVDDHLMEISDVIRAEEWLSSSPKHVLLYQAFDWDVPTFAHLPLLRNRDKSKISKRKNPVSIDFYKAQGYLPEALVNFLALMGWSMPEDKEIFTLSEMVQEFTFDRVDPTGPVFDLQKLDWLNGEYIRALTDEDLAERIVSGNFSKYTKKEILAVIGLVKERIKKLSEFDTFTSYLFTENLEPNIDLIIKVSSHKNNEITSMLSDFQAEIESVDNKKWKKEALEEIFKEKAEKLKWSKTNYFQTIRVVISGTNATPPLFDILEQIGKEKVQQRTDRTLKKLKELLG